MRLHSTLHQNEVKRRILNIIESVQKSLFGTLDEDDLILINQNIDKLFDKNTKLAKIVQNQTAMYRSILQSDTHHWFIQQYNRITDSKIHKLELLLIAEEITQTREHTNNLQETILLEKQGITRTDRPKLVF